MVKILTLEMWVLYADDRTDVLSNVKRSIDADDQESDVDGHLPHLLEPDVADEGHEHAWAIS